MGKRLTLSIAGALLLVLALAGPALAATDTPVPYGWMLQLRSPRFNEDMTSKAFRHCALHNKRQVVWTDDNKTPADPSDDHVYKGIALWRLVGRIDDRYPNAFNAALAASGYSVAVEAVDGFTATYTSAELVALGDKLFVADRMDGAPLNLGAASIKTDPVTGDYASWKPSWPAKLVSQDTSIPGSRRPAAVARISIMPAGTLAATDTPVPYGWMLQLRSPRFNEDMTSKAFRHCALHNKRQVVWTDDNKTPADPSDDHVYKGIALWRLVGRIDDRYPNAFNAALAASGYSVAVEAVDGFTATYTSAELVALGDKLFVADRMDGAPLNLGAASIKTDPVTGDYASWKPSWPAKLVSQDTSIPGSRRPAAVARISIMPAQGAEVAPFDGGVGVAREDEPTLTLIGKSTKVIERSQITAKVYWDGNKEGDINPSLLAVYRGQTLYKLVGKVDDADPSTFNTAKAKRGYKIRLICSDGYKPTIGSKRIIGKTKWIIAKLKDNELLPEGEAPFRFVGSFVEPFNCKLAARMVIKIRLIF